MVTDEQRQLCVRVIGSTASLSASLSGNQPRHMAGGGYESQGTWLHGCLRRSHRETIMPEERSRNEGVHTPNGSWDRLRQGMVRSACPRRLDHWINNIRYTVRTCPQVWYNMCNLHEPIIVLSYVREHQMNRNNRILTCWTNAQKRESNSWSDSEGELFASINNFLDIAE